MERIKGAARLPSAAIRRKLGARGLAMCFGSLTGLTRGCWFLIGASMGLGCATGL